MSFGRLRVSLKHFLLGVSTTTFLSSLYPTAHPSHPLQFPFLSLYPIIPSLPSIPRSTAETTTATNNRKKLVQCAVNQGDIMRRDELAAETDETVGRQQDI